MAQIYEQKVTITMSKLIRPGQEPEGPFLDNDVLSSIENVVEELLGDASIVVEISGGEEE